MRSKKTNFLQSVILISGLLYFIIGTFIFISPIWVGRLFKLDISSEWLNVIPNNDLFFIVYYTARGFAALVASVGAAMILPLFDPLKYRGLVYYTGAVFPFLSSLLFLTSISKTHNNVILVLGIIFLIIFLLTLTALLITKNIAKMGKE